MKIKKRLRSLIPEGSSVANILTLMIGTGLSQLLVILVSPVLTRLFSPIVFGVYGVYISMVSIITAFVTLRYDQALMLPKQVRDAASLFWAAILSVVGISIVSLVFCILFVGKIPLLLKIPELGLWILFLPISILLGGIYQTLFSWSARQKKFKNASLSQIVRSSATTVGQISFGIIKVGSGGLIGSSILGEFFSTLFLTFKIKRNDGKVLKESFRWSTIKQLSKQYLDFPIYNGTQSFLNVVSQNVPLIFLAKFFGPAVVGFYAIGVRILQMPTSLILTSLNQVLYQKLSEVHNSGEKIYFLFKKTTLALLMLTIVPVVVIFLFAPPIFGFVLGNDWIMAGEYARWLALWLAVSFINPPAILSAQIHRKQKLLLFQNVALLFFRLLAIIIGGIYLDAIRTVILYSAVGVVFNAAIILYMWLFLFRSQKINFK